VATSTPAPIVIRAPPTSTTISPARTAGDAAAGTRMSWARRISGVAAGPDLRSVEVERMGESDMPTTLP